MNIQHPPAVRSSRLRRPMGSAADALLLARILAFALVVPALMRLHPARLHALLEPRALPPAPRPGAVERVTAHVERVLRRGWPAVRRGCLTRGLTRYYFLRRAGIDVSLCFGLGTVDGAVAGHCWLEQDGEPLLEARDPRVIFTEMYRFPYRWPPAGSSRPAEQRRVAAR